MTTTTTSSTKAVTSSSTASNASVVAAVVVGGHHDGRSELLERARVDCECRMWAGRRRHACVRIQSVVRGRRLRVRWTLQAYHHLFLQRPSIPFFRRTIKDHDVVSVLLGDAPRHNASHAWKDVMEKIHSNVNEDDRTKNLRDERTMIVSMTKDPVEGLLLLAHRSLLFSAGTTTMDNTESTIFRATRIVFVVVPFHLQDDNDDV